MLEMKNQLLQLGCHRDRILDFTEYLGRQEKGKMEVYLSFHKRSKSKCLIITSSLGYHGGSITAAYAALELQNRGCEVVIAAPDGNIQFISEDGGEQYVSDIHMGSRFLCEAGVRRDR